MVGLANTSCLTGTWLWSLHSALELADVSLFRGQRREDIAVVEAIFSFTNSWKVFIERGYAYPPTLPIEDSPRELNMCTTSSSGIYTSPSVCNTIIAHISFTIVSRAYKFWITPALGSQNLNIARNYLVPRLSHDCGVDTHAGRGFACSKFARNTPPVCLFEALTDRTPSNFGKNPVSL